jgi:hypothetical protein
LSNLSEVDKKRRHWTLSNVWLKLGRKRLPPICRTIKRHVCLLYRCPVSSLFYRYSRSKFYWWTQIRNNFGTIKFTTFSNSAIAIFDSRPLLNLSLIILFLHQFFSWLLILKLLLFQLWTLLLLFHSLSAITQSNGKLFAIAFKSKKE